MKKQVKGFTIIELLLVIAVIVVLAMLLLPKTHRSKEYANKLNCASNLKQIYLAIDEYRKSRGMGKDFPSADGLKFVEPLFNGPRPIVKNTPPSIFICPEIPTDSTTPEGYWYRYNITSPLPALSASDYPLKVGAVHANLPLAMDRMDGTHNNHADGASVLYLDGSVEFCDIDSLRIRYTMDHRGLHDSSGKVVCGP